MGFVGRWNPRRNALPRLGVGGASCLVPLGIDATSEFTLTTSPRFGVALPQVGIDSPITSQEVTSFAKRADALGFDGLWTQDQIIGSAPTLEAIGLLCFVAASTVRVRLGVSVLVLAHRAPVPLAKALATLDQLSDGRLELGIGLGNPNPHEASFGLGQRDRLRRFQDGLGVLKALWAGGVANRASPYWPLRDTPMSPPPLQRPHPKLWFGGRHPKALARAVAQGNGWMGAGSSSLAQFAEQVVLVDQALQDAGRDRASFEIAKRVYLAIDDDETRAERRLKTWFKAYYGNADLASAVCVWGTANKVRDAVADVLASGADMVLLNPVFDHADHLETLAELFSVGPRIA